MSAGGWCRSVGLLHHVADADDVVLVVGAAEMSTSAAPLCRRVAHRHDHLGLPGSRTAGPIR